MKNLKIIILFLSVYNYGNASELLFKKFEPSIALIHNQESKGTGLIISTDGLVLTNYHVVNSILPYSVTVKYNENGQVRSNTFDNIKLFKVHPELDLAILKINSNKRFIPAQIRAVNAKNGEKCYAIGNPGFDKTVLQNTITEGLISSSERLIDKYNYIQFSAAVNPGNSGGPLVNENGDVIGIVTYKSNNTKNVNFAIPVTSIKLSDFLNLAERKDNLEKGLEYQKKGRELIEKYRLTSPYFYELKSLYKYSALYFFRLSLIEMPNQSSAYHNVGLMFQEYGLIDIAKIYFLRATKSKSPTSLNYNALASLSQIQGDFESQKKYLIKGSFLLGTEGWNSCTYDLANNFYSDQAFYSCFYLLKMLEFDEQQKNKGEVDRLIKKIIPLIEKKSFINLINTKKKISDYSYTEFLKVKNLDMEALKKSIESLKLLKKKLDSVASKTDHQLKKLITKSEDSNNNKWTSIKFKVDAYKSTPCYGGAYLAIQLKWLRKIQIVNTVTGEIVHSFNTRNEDYFIASSKGVLFIVYRDLNIVDAIDLNDFSIIYSKYIKDYLLINSIALGRDESNFGLINFIDSNGDCQIGILDMLSLNVSTLHSNSAQQKWLAKDKLIVNNSFDSVFSTQENLILNLNKTNKTYTIFKLEDLAEKKLNEKVQMSSDGSFFVSDRGLFISTNQTFKAIDNNYKQSELIPSIEGSMFLEIVQDKIFVRDAITHSVLFEYNYPSESFRSKESQFFLSGRFNRLSILTESELHISGLSTDNLNRRNSNLVSRGSIWTHDLSGLNFQKINIEDAPEGISLNNQKISWNIPPKESTGEKEILLSVINKDGKEDFYLVKVVVVE